MRRVPRLTKNERAILEASVADGDRSSVHINKIIPDLGGGEHANDQMDRLVGRGLGEWTLKPSRSMPNRVSLGEIRVTHAGTEALRLDKPLRRVAAWLADGVPGLVWGLTIAVVGAATGAAVTAWITCN